LDIDCFTDEGLPPLFHVTVYNWRQKPLNLL